MRTDRLVPEVALDGWLRVEEIGRLVLEDGRLGGSLLMLGGEWLILCSSGSFSSCSITLATCSIAGDTGGETSPVGSGKLELVDRCLMVSSRKVKNLKMGHAGTYGGPGSPLFLLLTFFDSRQ